DEERLESLAQGDHESLEHGRSDPEEMRLISFSLGSVLADIRPVKSHLCKRPRRAAPSVRHLPCGTHWAAPGVRHLPHNPPMRVAILLLLPALITVMTETPQGDKALLE